MRPLPAPVIENDPGAISCGGPWASSAIRLHHIDSKKRLTDLLTKNLSVAALLQFRRHALGMLLSLRGRRTDRSNVCIVTRAFSRS